MSAVLSEVTGAVMTVTIDRPEAHNALNRDVLGGLVTAIDRADATPGIRAVVLTGNGRKAFSAGADLKEIAAMGPDAAHETIRLGQHTMKRVAAARTPVIAAVDGLALGGGFELALSATFPLLSTRASLGLPESGLGLIPGYGGTQRLPRAIGSRMATYLMVTGARLEALRAYELGLTPVEPVPSSQLQDTAQELATTVARQGPLAVRSILQAVQVGSAGDMAAGLGLESGLAALAIAGAESTEGIAAFIERRRATFADASPDGGFVA